MALDKASTRPVEIPPEIWESRDHATIVKFIVDTPMPFWARKMWLFKWARFHSIHVDQAWVEELKAGLPEATTRVKPFQTAEEF